jgi:outer membrane protein assembly factor BamB
VFAVAFDRCDDTSNRDAPGILLALSLTDGAIAWQVALRGAADVHVRPEADDEIVVIGTVNDRRVQATDTYVAFDARTGARLWSTDFHRVPETLALAISRPPRLVDGVVVVNQGSLVADIRPIGLDAKSGQVLWHSQVGNEVLVNDTLIALDRVRDSPEQPLAMIGIDARTGRTRWRDPTLRGWFATAQPSDPLVLVSDRVVAIDTRSGQRLIDVPTQQPTSQRLFSRRGFLLENQRAIVVSTTPQTNVTNAETIVEFLDLTTGATTQSVREPAFTTSVFFGDDHFSILVAGGPQPSTLINYRVMRD